MWDGDQDWWQELIDNCTQGEIPEDFTSGEKIKDTFQGYDFGSTRGTRQGLAELESFEKHEITLPLVDGNLELVLMDK